MEYYNPIDRTSRRVAIIVTTVFVVMITLCLSFICFPPYEFEEPRPTLNILFEEPVEAKDESEPETSPTPATTTQATTPNPAHVVESKTEKSAQTSGESDQTQTLNPNAMFKPVTGNIPDQVPEGNPLAPNGPQESNKGKGPGYNLQGTDQLDEGLKGRGLREGLPQPAKKYNTEGTVVVSVVIDAEGNVTSASVDPDGTSTNDAKLRELAVEAALRAKFNPSERTAQGGVITYVFKLN